MYPELDEIGTGKEKEIATFVATPGLSSPLVTLGTSPTRGWYVATNGVLFWVAGNTIYTISSSYVSTSRGTLPTTTGPVSIKDNGLQIVVSDGTNAVWAPLTTSPIFQPLSGFLGSALVDYMALRFLFVVPGTNQLYYTDQNAVTFTADTGVLESVNIDSYSADPVLAHICDHQNIWLFKAFSTEIYYSDGVTPFSSISGAYLEFGIAAPYSLVKCDNTFFWLGQNRDGTAMVYQASGYAGVRTSTTAVEVAINSYSNLSGATAYAYQDDGHNFYVLNFPSANTTWVYDTSTKQWHERVYLNQGQYQRQLAQGHAYFNGIHIVGDYQSGNLYQLSKKFYYDNGAAISRERITPHTLTKDLDRVTYHSFQLDLEAGVGADGSGQGVNPQVMLQWSDDGGHNWSNEYWQSAGAIGATSTRVLWRRLGQSRDRVFKVKMTDPVKWRVLGAQLQLDPGQS